MKPAISGPARPRERIELQDAKEAFARIIGSEYERDAGGPDDFTLTRNRSILCGMWPVEPPSAR